MRFVLDVQDETLRAELRAEIDGQIKAIVRQEVVDLINAETKRILSGMNWQDRVKNEVENQAKLLIARAVGTSSVYDSHTNELVKVSIRQYTQQTVESELKNIGLENLARQVVESMMGNLLRPPSK